MIKIVIFDAFNTIVKRNKKYVTEPYRLVQSRASKELFNPMIANLSVRDYAIAIGAEYTIDEMNKIEDDLAIEISHIEVFGETVDVMKSLKQSGYKIAIASNLAEAYGNILKELFHDYVDEYYFSYEMGLAKPDPKFYEFIANDCKTKYGISNPKEYYMVGDNLQNDFKAPMFSGWWAVVIDRKGKIPFAISRLNSIFIELMHNRD